ncbi:polysaccharide deacetylase family protein [Agromyces soli]|uniref:Polysaccharide deacetylase family protein n=1 Tax=Agromyces soli TaxID=659012 RepID=A0ABY4ATQ6_9MICO|nr:polysaccharide deacetylase family protein [Agromyces soli]UOE26405.1 polysaccharide deacetylase family protein [Agromyces soli]
MRSGAESDGASRRAVLGFGAAALVSAALAACASERPAASAAAPSTPSGPPPRPAPSTAPGAVHVETRQAAPVLDRVDAPSEPITGLPGEGTLLAWTADDGTDSAVVAAYAAFAASTGVRLTLFVTGCYDSWAENADALRPLVDAGQVQLANHTWSHPDLTSLDDQGIVDELTRTHDFLGEKFGVDARPFFRPPFGYYDDRVIAAAASIGYTTPTLWYGSLADSGLVSEQQIVDLAGEWFLPQHIVIGHLNFAPVTKVFPQLHGIVVDRGLTTVTLNDVFRSEYHP